MKKDRHSKLRNSTTKHLENSDLKRIKNINSRFEKQMYANGPTFLVVKKDTKYSIYHIRLIIFSSSNFNELERKIYDRKTNCLVKPVRKKGKLSG